MELQNGVVLVTGAGRGIGRATAVAFAREGARVALMGRTKKNLVDAQKEIAKLGVETLVLPGDVSEEGPVARSVAAVEQRLGAIDVLVNNAGIFAGGPIERFDTVVFDRVLAVNLRGPFLMSRAVIPGMKARKTGHIVNIASTAGKRGYAGGGPYCASKFGLAGLSESMLYEVRGHGIRVTCVYPSTVNTDLTRKQGMLKDPERCIQPEDVAQAIVALVRMDARAMPTQLEIWQTNPA